jgi:hypothetical protein
MKKCPHCAEEIQDDAKVCTRCHSDLPMSQQALTPVTSGKATASVILGIFFFVWPVAVLAIVFGHLSRREIRRSGGRIVGAGEALVGLLLGYFGVFMLPLLIYVDVVKNDIPHKQQLVTIAVNQALAVGSLRTYNEAEVSYATVYNKGYSATLGNLGPPAGGTAPTPDAAGLVDSVLSGGSTTAMVAVKSGYRFTYSSGPEQVGRIATYQIWADPITPGTTGQHHYYTDQRGVIRYQTETRADENSPPLTH